MDAVSKCIQTLLSTVKRSEEYREYKKQETILGKNSQLKERVDQFRANNFRLQNEAGSDNLFQVADQLARESAQLRQIPEVNAYLDAELAMCKLVQRICQEIVEGIDMHVPHL